MKVQLARAGAGQRTVAVIAVAALTIAGCGSSKSNTSTSPTAQASSVPTTLALSISEVGKTAKFAGPASVQGGPVTVQLANNGRAPHGAQLVRIEGAHTIEQALKAL